jgi:hypothetical protein
VHVWQLEFHVKLRLRLVNDKLSEVLNIEMINLINILIIIM